MITSERKSFSNTFATAVCVMLAGCVSTVERPKYDGYASAKWGRGHSTESLYFALDPSYRATAIDYIKRLPVGTSAIDVISVLGLPDGETFEFSKPLGETCGYLFHYTFVQKSQNFGNSDQKLSLEFTADEKYTGTCTGMNIPEFATNPHFLFFDEKSGHYYRYNTRTGELVRQ